jgi:5S rRNA maturation endonuclease (ribonuclease M5)
MSPNRQRPHGGNREGVEALPSGKAKRRVAASTRPGADNGSDEWRLPDSVVLPVTRDGMPRTAAYLYEDADGSISRIVCRFESDGDKTFRQGRVVNGRYKGDVDDVLPVPFRLRELLRAVRTGRTIYVVEGEKDVLALEALGRAATCNPAGAGKWPPAFAKYFKGANRVVVIADKDDVGFAHARDVANSLQSVVTTLIVRQAKAGKDVSDHLAAGHDLSALLPASLPPRPATERRDKSSATKKPDGVLAKVLGRLRDLQEVKPGTWESLCPVPAHGDRSRSFSVSVGEVHPVLVKCHKTCSLEEICEALDVPISELCGRDRTRLSSRPLSDVRMERVEWLWKHRIPRGKLTVIDGDPEQGKSLLTLDLAARLSVGAPMPFSDEPGQFGVTIVVSAEDDSADTMAPRVEAAGGDRHFVREIVLPVDAEGYEHPIFLPEAVRELEDVIAESGAVLVIIDPFSAFVSTAISSHNDASIRQALTPLRKAAERTGAAIVLVRHFNKTPGLEAVHRGGGSVAIGAIGRSGMMVARAPGDDDLRVVAQIKNNLAPRAPSLSFRVAVRTTPGFVDEQGRPVEIPAVDWVGQIDLTANDLVARQDARRGCPGIG